MQPFFNSFLVSSLKPALVGHLSQLGYELSTGSSGGNELQAAYTMVHLLAGGPEQQLVSVKVAEDDKDEQLQQQAEAELSEDKRGMVERILAASTLGEVLLSAGLASLKSAFRRLSLMVCLFTGSPPPPPNTYGPERHTGHGMGTRRPRQGRIQGGARNSPPPPSAFHSSSEKGGALKGIVSSRF